MHNLRAREFYVGLFGATKPRIIRRASDVSLPLRQLCVPELNRNCCKPYKCDCNKLYPTSREFPEPLR